MGHCRVLSKINDNAYMVDLPKSLAISNTLNVVDLYNYHSPDTFLHVDANSWMSFLSSRGD